MLWCNRPSDLRTPISNAPAEGIENETSQSRCHLDCFQTRASNCKYGPTHSETPRLPPVLFDDLPSNQKSQPAVPPQVYVPSTFKCSSSTSSMSSSPSRSRSELSSLTSHPSISTMCCSPSTPSSYRTPKVPRIPARFEAQHQSRKGAVFIQPEILSPIPQIKSRTPLQELSQEPPSEIIDESEPIM